MKRIYDALWLLGHISGCHQMSERSFFLKDKQFPVCARCTGALLGYILGTGIFLFYNIPVFFCICLCFPLLIDWFLQRVNIVSSTNIRRLVTGVLCGAGLIQLHLFFIEKFLFFMVNLQK